MDGFDEMDEGLRREAIRQLNRARYPVLVFSRPGQFADAVADGLLSQAVALELVPVAAPDAVDFLRGLDQPPERLIAHLTNEPDSTVSAALTKPLTLTMVRDAFPPRHLAGLDDMLARHFSSPRDVEAYLLDRLVTIRYQEDETAAYPPPDAERWLTNPARAMAGSGTYSFDWRRLHHVWDRVSPWPRIAAAGLLGLLVSVPGGLLAFGPGHYIAFDGRTGVGFGAVLGLVVGTSVGLTAGLVSELRDPVPRRRLRRRSATAGSRWRANWGAGALVAIVIGTTVGNNRFGAAGAVGSGLLTEPRPPSPPGGSRPRRGGRSGPGGKACTAGRCWPRALSAGSASARTPGWRTPAIWTPATAH
ncbi:hypothetical protein [Streptomyces sp. NPDC004134]|uniref:hypothetical protein n=1 Tax=Streptomyces sp. NPDC004134 TaxID=3364691 RepID=UPI00367DF686